MKTLLIILFLTVSFSCEAGNKYRHYLLSKFYSLETAPTPMYSYRPPPKKEYPPYYIISRFERPKGAIFCRMEDYLTAKIKVWIKVGVK